MMKWWGDDDDDDDGGVVVVMMIMMMHETGQVRRFEKKCSRLSGCWILC